MSSSTASTSRASPILGSDYLLSQSAPATPDSVPALTPSLCSNVSAFKQLIASYRRLDDSINLRMSRAHAMATRDPRKNYSEMSSNECTKFWLELLDLWKARDSAIRYCVDVADARLSQRRQQILGPDHARLGSTRDDRLDLDREQRDQLYSEEVKRFQVAQELGVENIVRQRTLAAFMSRCPSFERPASTSKDSAQLDLPEIKSR